MSSTVVLNVNNIGSSAILVCARGGTACSTMTAFECNTTGGTSGRATINSKTEGRLFATPSNNNICLSIFSESVGLALPLATGILRTTTNSASFDLSWNGAKIKLLNSQCNVKPSATVDKVKNIEVVIVNTLTNATVYFCNSQEAANCEEWDFVCNPCGSGGTFILPSSLGRTKIPTNTNPWCLALWVTAEPTPPSRITGGCPESSTNTKRLPNKTIIISPIDSTPPQSGLQIVVGGISTSPTFTQTVFYTCDVIPLTTLAVAEEDRSFFSRFWWLILIIIVIIIIIIIAVALSSARKTQTPDALYVHNYNYNLPTAVATPVV